MPEHRGQASSTSDGQGERNVIIYSSLKLPNRKSDSYHPVKRHCWCFKCELVLLHNSLPLYVLYAGTVEEGDTTICPKKAMEKVVERCMSKRLCSVCVVCVSTCERTGAEG